MKKLYLFFAIIPISLFAGKNAVAADHTQFVIDSLQALIMKEKNDTVKIKLYSNLLEEHVYYKQEEGLKLVEPALRLAEKINWLTAIYIIKQNAGRICWRMNRFEQALEYHFDALRISEKLGNKEFLLTSLKNIGQDYGDNSNYPEALNYFNKALAISEEMKNKAMSSDLYGLISWVHKQQGNYPECTRYSFIAMELAEQIGDKDGVAVYLGNIAEDYFETRKHSLALLYMDSSIALLKEVPDYINLSLAYTKKGKFYIQLRNYAEAIKYFQLGLKVGIETNDIEALSGCYSAMADARVEMGNDTEALRNYQKASDCFKLSESLQPVSELYVKIAACLTRLKHYNEANKYLSDAFALSKNFKSESFFKKYYGSLELLDSATGKWKSAYLNHKAFIRYRDKLYNDENTKKIMQSTLQYEFDKKETVAKVKQETKDVIAVQQLQKQKILRNAFIAGFVLVLLLVVLTFSRYREKQKSNTALAIALNELKDAQHQLVQSEKLAAFGVIATRIAHEIHNPLNFVNNFSELSEDLIQDFVSTEDYDEKKELEKILIDNLKKINHHGKRAQNIVSQLQEHTNKGTAHEFFENE
jgi:tetratricopeptide (TPR) repeat protein